MSKCSGCGEDKEGTCDLCGKMICTNGCDVAIQDDCLELYLCSEHDFKIMAKNKKGKWVEV